MSKSNEVIILSDSPEAATLVTVTGWMSRDQFFYHDDEQAARWSGATHLRCKTCQLPHKKTSYCESCFAVRRRAAFAAMPFKEYDGSPCVIFDTETYFFSPDEIEDYCADNNLTELELVFCEPQYFFEVRSDYWVDVLPREEDFLPPAIASALDALNKAISTAEPASWIQGEERTIYKIEGENSQ